MERKPGRKHLGHPWVPVARKTSKLPVLLAASILSSCCPLSHAQREVKVKVEPANPIQGESVTFTPELGSRSFSDCCWYKDEIAEESVIICMTKRSLFSKGGSGKRENPGPAYTQRETLDSRCILRITNVQLSDSRIYKVQTQGTMVPEAGRANLEVIDPTENITNTITSPASTMKNPESIENEGSTSGSAIWITSPSTTMQNSTNLEERHGSPGSSIWIIVCLVLILALVATIAYFVFRVHRLKNTMTPAQTAPLAYENLPPPQQDKPQSSNEAKNIYQSILPGHQGDYEQLSWKQSNPPAAGLRI